MHYLTGAIHAALVLIYGLTGSYGWSILLLTLGLRLALLPLQLWHSAPPDHTAAPGGAC